MADKKRRGLGSGIAALIPNSQAERSRAIDVFFDSQKNTNNNGDLSPVDPKNNDRPVQSSSHDTTDTPQSPTRGTSTSRISKTDGNRTGNTQNFDANTKKATKNSLRRTSNVSRETFEHESLTKNNEDNILTTNISADNDGEVELVPVPGTTFGEIPVHAIIPNTKQPRTIFDDDELSELAASIKEVGVLQPIVIRPLAPEFEKEYPEASYELIMGERRWRATQRAGLDTIPAIVRHTEDEDLLRDALLENLHRVQLNALEEAAAYQQLLDDFHITQEELSKKIARSRPQISNTLRLLKLPSLVQRRVAAGVLSAGHARALLGLSDPAAMERLAQRIVAEGLSVRAVEEIVALGDTSGNDTPLPRKRTQQYVPELNELAERLTNKFDTRVRAQMGAHKGKVTIEFASIDDLNRILDILGEERVAE